MRRQNRIAFFNILSIILLNGISLLTAPLFSRILGTSGYGVLRIYNIWAGVASILFTFQTQGTLVNARVEYPEDRQLQYQSATMALSLFAFLSCSAVILLFLEPVSGLLKLEPMLIGFLLMQAFGSFCVNFLSTKYTYEFKAGRNMVLSLAITLVTLVLSLVWILRLPQESRYLGRVAAIAVTYGVVGIPICASILLQGRTLFHKEYWKFCIVLAIPAVFHNLSDLVLGQSDMVMLQQLMGDTAAGLYGLAWQFGNFLFIIFGALNRTWCPYFFEEMKQGQQETMLAKTRNYLELFTVLACGFMLLTPEVYRIYAGQAFWDGTMLVPLFVASYYLNFLCTFPVNYEYYHKKTKVVAAVTIFCSLMNVVLNYVLIQAIGMAGAAVATMLSHGLQLVLHHVYTRFFLGKGEYPFPVNLWAKYGIAFVAVMLAVYLNTDRWLVRWGMGACIGIAELLAIRKRKVLI